MDSETTIVAVSSPSGKSSHALIRASGSQAWRGAEKLGLSIESRKLVSGRLTIGESSLPVLVSLFPANNSFTGQDTVEICLTNNARLIDSVLSALVLVTNGRLAEAGEFTARAFLHGNISLSAAEGVCATISANNDAELQGASLLRGGALARATEPIARQITQALALVEAGIDFTDEEDVVAISENDLLHTIQQCIASIDGILDGKISMETLRCLPRVVITGKPNAGKSTLFNALLGTRRAVISNVSGTTRDAIAEPVYFGNKEALLIDVAGCDVSNDALTLSMQEAAQRAIDSADILLLCIAPNCEVDTPSPHTIVVHTKGDLQGADPHAISSTSGRGVEELKQLISLQLSTSPTPRLDALALLPRHESSLQETIHSLTHALEQVQTPELVAASLRESLNAIGTITGHVTPDEIIGEVFSTFCIGK